MKIDIVNGGHPQVHEALGITFERFNELKDFLYEVVTTRKLTVVERMAILADEAKDINEYSILVFYLGLTIESARKNSKKDED